MVRQLIGEILLVIANGTTERPLLLLAEDDEDIAELFARAFRKRCPLWRLIRADNGVSAVEHIMTKGMPQAVITDLKMPHMDGYELIAWIRAQDSAFRIPIVVMSSFPEADCSSKCLGLGANECIPKDPSGGDLEELFKRLDCMLKNSSHECSAIADD